MTSLRMEAPDKGDWDRDMESWCLDMALVLIGGVILTTYGAIKAIKKLCSVH